ncbi:MAG: MerR family transcriptional regulator [Chloroflexi bacterium]|nr:MerR family transcriptional regulator [Chloroflexota bacterium]MCL5952405.1 MerR family transcriptional regulator [Chloroflexota bacterium]
MTDDFKTLQDAASELGVTLDTLQLWARDYSLFLSPAAGVGEDGAGRRLTSEDLLVLRRIKEQLAAGLNSEEISEQLHAEGRGETARMQIVSREGGSISQAGAFAVLTDTLRAMLENQQTIQNSLQVNRNLQGVIIQDNFNLKEENIKLRERMQKLEQELADLRKRDSDHRLLLEQRLARLEQEARRSIWSKLF